MSKVDARTFNRIIELKTKYNLTHAVIAERLGLSIRTIKVYLRAHRTGTLPYHPNVLTENSPEAVR